MYFCKDSTRKLGGNAPSCETLWASLKKRHNVMKQTREPPQQRFDGS
jgi:hypothetical protein